MDRPTFERCRRYRAAVSLELDGELSQLERAYLRSHGVRCSACRRFRADATAITHTLRSAPLEPSQLSIALPARRRRRIAVSYATASVATVLVASLGSLYAADLGRRAPEPSPIRTAPGPAYYESVYYELSLLQPAQVDRSSSPAIRM